MARTATFTDEKEVEDLYREAIRRLRAGVEYDFRHNTDGYARWGSVRLLLEVKLKENLKDRKACCKVLGQLLFYLKKFERDGEVLPNVLLAGDEHHFFVVSTASVIGFLNTDGVDWSTAPSAGSKALLKALVEQAIIPPLYEVGAKDFKEALLKCESISEDSGHHTKATSENIGTMFSVRWAGVVKDPDLTPVEQVDVFLKCLFRPSGVALQGGQLHVPGYDEAIKVDRRAYEAFVSHFHQGYTPSEVEHFYSMKDRLVEEVARRRQGAFFTPDLWVAEAHKEIEKVLGPKWRDECIVWDPAAGTANLTRDYTFKDIILSTAEKPDVQVIRDQGYNKGASVFQYDFLNPGGESPFLEKDQRNTLSPAVERQLAAAAKAGKRLVFFMNPPYGTAGGTSTIKDKSKAGIAGTAVNRDMGVERLGLSRTQLYAQFMYCCHKLGREYGFKKSTVALFSMPKFITSGGYKPFRDWWYKSYTYKGGFLFQASHFAGVSGAWGVAFTIWSEGSTEPRAPLPIRLTDELDFSVVSLGTKELYNSDDREASSWVRAPLGGRRSTSDTPKHTSGLKISERWGGGLLPDSLGVLVCKANSVYTNAQGTWVLSGKPADCNIDLDILVENWNRVIALYAARKLITGTWDNHENEYLCPEEDRQGYEPWVGDAHVYALLEMKNNCTAMRDVQYKGETHRIKNHWFWMTKAEALAAYNTSGTPNLYRDCKDEPSGHIAEPDLFTPSPEVETWRENGDSYFSHVLPGLGLSDEAKKVLDLLKALHLKSLPKREAFSNSHPELHLNAWDAGVYQLKHLWRAEYPEEWKELQVSFKVLEEKLRPGVYEYGFLLR